MLALLEGERQALAGLDLERILTCAQGKLDMCDQLSATDAAALDDECLGLLDAVRRVNETNRRLRNLIATNMAARFAALTGSVKLYHRAIPAH
ncbi:hypothetical protein PK98_02705 [Croceibacterium mercuriale]|uniref:Flagellar protein FlgN n=2 Tax=Croceibacterium mercuriale TaxID=1572751 RepID=A0A0B2BYL6_9SPHN|nr:hypothetical protein PK98_02705 [Croceibacterium mercuriale]